jgi:pimeloyl-ACP methyl ester carboxylesterase
MTCIPVDLAYEEHGQGFPLVLLHGFPLNRTIWYPILPELAEQARVILPDLRGFGQTPVEGDDVYSMRLLAEDVARLLDRLEIERAAVVGHSMGGYVALAFAHAYPHRLAGLGLVASRPEPDSPEKRQTRFVSARNVRRYGVKSLARKMPMTLTDDPQLGEALNNLICSADSTAVAAALKGMADRDDATDWLAGIKVPALVVAGENDHMIPLPAVQSFVNFLPRGWLVTVPNAGHMPMMEAPEIVAEALKQLLRHAETVPSKG